MSVAGSTTLELVNRLRRRFREEDVTGIDNADDMSNFCIDLLNEAMRDILESYNWDFDRRTDGEFFTKAPINETANIQTEDSEVYFTFAGTSDQKMRHFVGFEYPIPKIIVTSDTQFPDTAFGVERFNPGNTSFFWNDQNGIGYFRGDTNATASVLIVYDEYVLPPWVRAVTSIRHQEQSLQLIEVDRDIGMDGAAPRPHGDLSSSPVRAFIGKHGASCRRIDISSELPTSFYRHGITVKLDPTPNAALALHYSYLYKHATLTATNNLEQVDLVVEDLIVRLAEARGTMSGLGADIQTGAAMEQEVFARCNKIHANERKDPLRRVVITPTLGGRSVPSGFGSLPRNFGSL